MDDALAALPVLRGTEEEAFRHLVERYSAMVYAACLRGLGGNAALAEDAAQAVFVVLAENARKIRDRSSLAGWLFGTANRVVTHLKREEVRRRRREAKAAAMVERERSMRPEEQIWEGARGHLNEAIASLRPKQREAVVRHFLEGRPQKEVARELGCSENAVALRISYALDKLRKFFARRGFSIPAAALAAFLGAEAAEAAPAGLAAACCDAGLRGLSGAVDVSSGPAGIAKGAMKMMLWAKVKTVTAGVVAALAIGAGALTVHALAADMADTKFPPGWPMLAANPERTSWVPEEVRGNLKPLWWKRVEPYISQKVQVIAGYDTIYVSTARGLYALDAATGEERWVYGTEIPLGHSPTLYDGVAYVGGFDRKIHAVDAKTGRGLWTFTGGAGFQTNPLVVNGAIYAGCRDGVMYAVDIKTRRARWKVDVGAPIQFSAAYKDDVIFFGTADSHAYALDARTGRQVWKSKKLPGAGFRSYWPVVYKDRVFFYGSNAYNFRDGNLNSRDLAEAFPAKKPGALLGKKRADGWVDASSVLDYYKKKPWRRTSFVLDIKTGEEKEVPPLVWGWDDGAGNRYPPVVGGDGNLYQQAVLMYQHSFGGRSLSGWKLGRGPSRAHTTSTTPAAKQPPKLTGCSAGGNIICCNRRSPGNSPGAGRGRGVIRRSRPTGNSLTWGIPHAGQDRGRFPSACPTC